MASRDEGKPSPGPYTSLVQVKIGDQIYDARHAPGCKVCNHPARMDIELSLVEGWSYTKIARQYSEVEYDVGGRTMLLPEIKWSAIRYHYQNGHVPLGAEIQRRLIEKRAEDLGHDLEKAADRFVDQYTVAQTVMYKGHDRIVRGELQPSIQDTLAAAKLVQQIEENADSDWGSEAWEQAMTVYFETAQALMPEPLWQEFGRRLSSNPILAALARKQEGIDDPDAIDVEYEEEPA